MHLSYHSHINLSSMLKISKDNIMTQPILRTDVILSDDDLNEEAKRQFDFHTEILRTFQMTSSIILANDRFTPIGRHLFCTSIEQNYTNCKNVLNYVATHPQVKMTAHSMPPLFVLCGASRTGSTLLHNLLACDPRSRSPTLLDMQYPVPPIARSDTVAQEQRSVISDQKSKDIKMDNYDRERNASHPSFTYEEDVLILNQGGFTMPLLEPLHSTELATWFYDNTNKDFIYEYHKTFMQMLNSVDAPQSHWILKSPHHTYNLDTLLRHYPSVSLIMTHRHLDEALPSSIRLSLSYGSIYFDSTRSDAEIDRQMIIQRRLHVADVQINRIVKFRHDHPHVPVFDIFYDDLITKPIDVVRRIYKHFGLIFSETFEQAMITWLRENPQGKQGRNTYSLEEFGLTHDIIEKRYEEYNRMFINP